MGAQTKTLNLTDCSDMWLNSPQVSPLTFCLLPENKNNLVGRKVTFNLHLIGIVLNTDKV